MARNHKKVYEGMIAGLYDIEETIGTGHFAVVKLARHVFTGVKVAVKVIDKTKLDEISKAHLFQEVRCMKLVQHPHVVRLYEVIDTQTKLYLILELGDGGDMYDYIMKHETGVDEMLSKKYFKQIVTAISYCHQLHVVHRDLKPENVVFFPKLGAVKLTDFGFSNKFIPGTKLETSCGSLAYSAPEILLGDSYDPPAVDVWSLGVLLFMLVCGEPPFQEANDSETLTMILDCKYKMPKHVSTELQDLIDKMLRRDPSARILLDDILNHPWIATDPNADNSCHVALVSREHLSDSDHNLIIDRMADGKIATREEIVSSLEQNSYNHITATYYLLAERRLKKYHETHSSPKPVRMNSAPAGTKPFISPLALSPRVPPKEDGEETQFSMTLKSLVSPVAPQAAQQFDTLGEEDDAAAAFQSHRKFSLIREESEDSEASESKEQVDIDMEMSHVIKHVRSTEDDLSCKSTGEMNMSMGSLSLRRTVPSRPLRSVSSSPQLLNIQLLNQICEEGESDDEDDDLLGQTLSSPRWIHERASLASPEMIRKFHNRKKRLHGSKSRTGTSCSSSDASDTDENETRKRKQKLKSQMHRRDSSDYSSDTDGPGGHGPSGGAGQSWGGSGGGRGGGGGGGRSKKDRDRDEDNNDNNKRRKSSGSNNMKGKQQNGSCSGSHQEDKKVPQSDKAESAPKNGIIIHVEPVKNLSRRSDGQKSSNLSLASNLSNWSLSSRGSKYIVDPCSNTPCQRTVDTNNMENRLRNLLLHEQARDFTDLTSDKGREKYDCGKDFLVRKLSSSGVIRKCSKDKIKSNGDSSNRLMPDAKSLDKSMSRCCSVV